VEVALRDDDVVCAELLNVLGLVRGRRERGDLGAERVGEQDGVMSLQKWSVLWCSRSQKGVGEGSEGLRFASGERTRTMVGG
jgi:hypothetical protein